MIIICFFVTIFMGSIILNYFLDKFYIFKEGFKEGLMGSSSQNSLTTDTTEVSDTSDSTKDEQEPPKAANKTRKKQASIKEVETTENNISAWSGTSYCTVTFGRKNESIKLVKMSETEYVMHFAQKSIKLSKDGNGKYIGYGDGAVRSKFSFEINENKGYMIGRSRLNAMGTLLAFSVAASGVCKYEFFRK